jgi:hypothetical protein
LLRLERAAETRRAAEAGAQKLAKWQRPRTLDEMGDSILRKLEAFDAKRVEEEEMQHAAEAERWRQCWGRFGSGEEQEAFEEEAFEGEAWEEEDWEEE